jgi:hypothetical protein
MNPGYAIVGMSTYILEKIISLHTIDKLNKFIKIGIF